MGVTVCVTTKNMIRRFHSLSILRAEESTAVKMTVRQSIEETRLKWLKTYSATRFQTDPGTEGPFYVTNNKNSPFPLNPLYIAQRPLSNETKNEIFNAWRKDSTEWTSKKLAMHFGISILRVEAILRHKSLENQWKNVSIAKFLINM